MSGTVTLAGWSWEQGLGKVLGWGKDWVKCWASEGEVGRLGEKVCLQGFEHAWVHPCLPGMLLNHCTTWQLPTSLSCFGTSPSFSTAPHIGSRYNTLNKDDYFEVS